MIECAGPHCDMLVEVTGDTCSVQCFLDWYRYYEGSDLLILGSDVTLPRPKEQQPWYGREVMR